MIIRRDASLRRAGGLALLFVAFSGLDGKAAAASFDCAQAAAPDEKTICADPALSALDSEMGGLWFGYSRVPMLMGADGTREDDARAFLTTRAKCGEDKGCLTAIYLARITALKRQLGSALDALGAEAGITGPSASQP